MKLLNCLQCIATIENGYFSFGLLAQFHLESEFYLIFTACNSCCCDRLAFVSPRYEYGPSQHLLQHLLRVSDN